MRDEEDDLEEDSSEEVGYERDDIHHTPTPNQGMARLVARLYNHEFGEKYGFKKSSDEELWAIKGAAWAFAPMCRRSEVEAILKLGSGHGSFEYGPLQKILDKVFLFGPIKDLNEYTKLYNPPQYDRLLLIVETVERCVAIDPKLNCAPYDLDGATEERSLVLDELAPEFINQVVNAMPHIGIEPAMITGHLALRRIPWSIEIGPYIITGPDSEIDMWRNVFAMFKHLELKNVSLSSCPRCGVHKKEAKFEVLRVELEFGGLRFDPRDRYSIFSFGRAAMIDTKQYAIVCCECGAQDIDPEEFSVKRLKEQLDD